MNKNGLIATIENVDFWYGGYNDNNNGYHLVYTSLYNFHLDKDRLDFPTIVDCKRLYQNTY
ncbi:MAG: hypothetical protein RR255_00055 [Bacilli bacterium]